MAVFGAKWRGVRSVCMVLLNFAVAFVCIKAERGLRLESARFDAAQDSVSGNDYLFRAVNFLWQSDKVGYKHVWPVSISCVVCIVIVKFSKLFVCNNVGYIYVFVKFIVQEMKFGWQIVVGSAIGFFGAAFGSVGGVGGGGIFVPMLSLIVGFDPKSATAISKCK